MIAAHRNRLQCRRACHPPDPAQSQERAVRRLRRRRCKLIGIKPHAYLVDAITKIVNGHPNSKLDDMLPWAYQRQDLKALA
jgi:hypothetical protein